MKRLICCLMIAAICLTSLSCAGVGKFTPGGADKAVNAISTALTLLHTIDSVYGELMRLKLLPDYTVQATRLLAAADAAAAMLKKIIAGATVTDAELNALAGQVDGIKKAADMIGAK